MAEDRQDDAEPTWPPPAPNGSRRPRPGEKANRQRSGFLAHQSEAGLFADFHAHRHGFISALGRAGVPLATAQKLARNSTPGLTANVYTHLGLTDRISAIEALPSPPAQQEDNLAALEATGTDRERRRSKNESPPNNLP